MAKRVLHIVVGVLLIAVFLVWLQLRFWEPIKPHVAMGEPLGWLAYGAAWLCLICGVAMLGNVAFGNVGRDAGEADPRTGSDDSLQV